MTKWNSEEFIRQKAIGSNEYHLPKIRTMQGDVVSYHVHNTLVPALDHPPFWPDHIFPFYMTLLSTAVLRVFSIVRRKNRQYLIYVIVFAAL